MKFLKNYKNISLETNYAILVMIAIFIGFGCADAKYFYGLIYVVFVYLLLLLLVERKVKKRQKRLQKIPPRVEKNSVIVNTFKLNDSEWMDISDIIFWLKSMQIGDSENSNVYHELIKQVIKMKNQKVLNHDKETNT